MTEKGKWAVIQQGMNPNRPTTEGRQTGGYARRYHWLSENVRSFIEESQVVCCDRKEEEVLNMVSDESKNAQKVSLDALDEANLQKTLDDFLGKEIPHFSMHAKHTFRLSKITKNALMRAAEINPQNYEELLSLRGIGPASVRALALISETIYGTPASWKDPVKYSFTHGGKDGIPYPVDRPTYDKSIEILRNAIDNAKIGQKDKLHALRKLNEFASK
jgi:hypothetical protein